MKDGLRIVRDEDKISSNTRWRSASRKNFTKVGYPFHHLPPLGIATLRAFLKLHGFKVSQDDLRIKAFYYNLFSSNDKINLSLFDYEKRILKFIEKGYEDTLEKEAEKIFKLTKFNGFDVIGFSLSETYTSAVAGIALVLAKLIKEHYEATIILGGRIHEGVAEKLLTTKFIDYGLGCQSPYLKEKEILNFLKDWKAVVS